MGVVCVCGGGVHSEQLKKGRWEGGRGGPSMTCVWDY